MPRITALKINSVWSSYGHTFITSGDTEEFNGNVMGYYVDCLTCGAHYVLRATPDELSDGAYFSANGDEPAECSRDTGMQHGDAHDSGHELDCEEGCEHCRHACNCIICC